MPIQNGKIKGKVCGRTRVCRLQQINNQTWYFFFFLVKVHLPSNFALICNISLLTFPLWTPFFLHLNPRSYILDLATEIKYEISLKLLFPPSKNISALVVRLTVYYFNKQYANHIFVALFHCSVLNGLSFFCFVMKQCLRRGKTAYYRCSFMFEIAGFAALARG